MPLDADGQRRVVFSNGRASVNYRMGTNMSNDASGKFFRVGFTGTRTQVGPDAEKWLTQEMKLLDIFIRLQLMKTPTLHHGDCVGADATAHAIALKLGWRIIVHPPLNESHRAFCKGASKTLRARKYLDRNRRIIQACSLLLAIPGTPLMEADVVKAFDLQGVGRGVGNMSGTWYTVLQALSSGGCEVRVYGTPPW